MYAKVLMLIVTALLVAAALLSQRQQRIETTHEIAALHRQITNTRYDIWRLEAAIAPHLDPQTMRRAIDAAGMTLEPIRAYPTPPRPQKLAALKPLAASHTTSTQ